MLRNMSFFHFIEWQASESLDPFSEERMDYRIASIVQTLVNLNRKRGQRPYPITDFLIRFGQKKAGDDQTAPSPTVVKKKQPWQVLYAMGAQIAAAYSKKKK